MTGRADAGDVEILRDERLAGMNAEDLAARFGTPLYVYDLAVVDGQVDRLRAAIPAGVDLAYAVKANPALAIVGHLARRGLGADVASAGELELVRRAGVAPERIVFTGPGKQDHELHAAAPAGLRAITVESPGELERLERIASGLGVRPTILLRASAAGDGPLEDVRLIGGDGASKFGMDDGDLDWCARRAVRSDHVELVGLHAFGASNVRDASALVDHVAASAARARRLSVENGFSLRLLDAGGGLGIPYRDDELPLDLNALGSGLDSLAARWAADPVTGGMRLLLEPGRFLVGPAGSYVARVVDRKSVGETSVAILDGGVHHLMRPALVRQEHRVALVARRPEPDGAVEGRERAPSPGGPILVAGPLCTGLDIFSRAAALPGVSVGDLLAVLDVGAYGFTEAMPFFLSHPAPAEVVVRDGRAELVRPRLDPRTWLDWQHDPGW